MTKEEAITEIFKKYNVPTSNPFFFEILKTLEQEPMREFTKEEAKAYSKALDKMYKPTGFNVFNEPSGDLISRQAMLNLVNADWKYENLESDIANLPPVTPQPKMGHWITKIKSDLRGDMWPTNPKCSECGGEPYYSNTIYNYNFCPYCGAKMQTESEEQTE